jgi:hypothetical protein
MTLHGAIGTRLVTANRSTKSYAAICAGISIDKAHWFIVFVKLS